MSKKKIPWSRAIMLQKRSLIRNHGKNRPLIRNYEEEKAPEKETKPIGWIEKSNIQSSPAVISLYFKEHFITFPTTRGGSIQTFYSVSTYEAGYTPPPHLFYFLLCLSLERPWTKITLCNIILTPCSANWNVNTRIPVQTNRSWRKSWGEVGGREFMMYEESGENFHQDK